MITEHKVGTRVLIVHSITPGRVGLTATVTSIAHTRPHCVTRQMYRVQLITIDGLGSRSERGVYGSPPEWLIPLPDPCDFIAEERETELAKVTS